ncbi:MAG TPA: S4 domain-containing protein [Gemmatimonadales bacterium]|nr:S4 domain-containing protein [Gemmatimonadales bacterium]
MKPDTKGADLGRAVRLDKWLWAARFYKTRALAAAGIDAGKVQVNGVRVKRSRGLEVGDQIRVRLGPYEHIVTVRLLTELRGPPSRAAQLYEEDREGKRVREALAAQIKLVPPAFYRGKGRPTKKARRDITRWKGED